MSLTTITTPSSLISYVNLADTSISGIYKLKINVHNDLKAEAEHPEPQDLMSIFEVAEYLHKMCYEPSTFTFLDLEIFEHRITAESNTRMISYTLKVHCNSPVFSQTYRTKYINFTREGGIYNDCYHDVTDCKDHIGFPENSKIRLAVDVWDGIKYTPQQILERADVGGEVVDFIEKVKPHCVTYIIWVKPCTECITFDEAVLRKQQAK